MIAIIIVSNNVGMVKFTTVAVAMVKIQPQGLLSLSLQCPDGGHYCNIKPCPTTAMLVLKLAVLQSRSSRDQDI
jgi:hypothetical protein